MTSRLPLSLVVMTVMSLSCQMSAIQVASPTPSPSTNATSHRRIATVTPTAAPSETAEVQTATVTKPVVRIHQAPDSDVITGYLSEGDKVVILACDGDWCQIKAPEGFVFRGCLSDNPNKLGCQAK